MVLRDVYELTSGILACMAAYIFLIQRTTKNIRGTRWITLAYMAGSIGALLIGLRDEVPRFFSMPVANAAVMLSNVFIYWGYAELMKLGRRRYWIVYATVLPELSVIIFFTYVRVRLGSLIIAYNVFSAVQYALLAYLLLEHGTEESKTPRYTMAALYGAWILVVLARAINVDINDPTVVLQLGSPIQTVGPVLSVVETVMTGFGFVWLAMVYLHSDLEIQSRVDPLTGLLNRGAFGEAARREMLRSRRQRSPLSMIIVDLDHFKAVNDRHGHAAGDAALVQASQCMLRNLRGTDLIARFGGEEFVALLPDTEAAIAGDVAERLRGELFAQCVEYDGKSFNFSASFGVATLVDEDARWEETLQRADRALYRAKNGGRNKVEICWPSDGRKAEIPGYAQLSVRDSQA